MQRLPINEKKVAELIRQSKHLNVFPMFFGFYFPKTESNPVADLLSELIEDSVDYLKIMSEDEVKSLIDSLPLVLQERIDHQGTLVSSDDLLQRVALNYLIAVVQEGYLSYKKVVSINLNQSEVIKIYPEIRDRFDDDGLLFIDERFKLSDGGIEYKNHILHYHQFLRRGFRSNPNFDFLSKFIRCYYESRVRNQFRIAIDHHRIMPKQFYQQIVELDTWFGPTFDEKKLDDINAIGLTMVKRRKPSLFDLSGNLEHTEFYWSSKDGIKTLEIEETSGRDYYFDQYFLNRYVHAERDTKRRILRHFDGAVKVYLKDSYEERMESQMPTEFKCAKKVKVFRIDGDLDLADWLELISLFYKGNEMIMEYFDPNQFDHLFGEKIRHYQSVRSR